MGNHPSLHRTGYHYRSYRRKWLLHTYRCKRLCLHCHHITRALKCGAATIDTLLLWQSLLLKQLRPPAHPGQSPPQSTSVSAGGLAAIATRELGTDAVFALAAVAITALFAGIAETARVAYRLRNRYRFQCH